MTKSIPLRSAASAIALLCATTANADVSAAEVWADWQESLAIYGTEGVSIGTETMSGDTLTVSDLSLIIEDDMTKVTAEMGALTFTELGDGTVSVAMPTSYPILIENADGNTIKMTTSQSGLKMIVSGTAAQMNYAVSADQYAIKIDEITEDGMPIKADIRVVVNNLAGSYATSTGDLREITYDMTAASVDMLADIAPPETAGDYVTLSGKIEGLATTAEMTLPLADDMEDPEDLFKNGFAMTAGYTYQKGAYIFDVNSEGEQTAGSASTGTGSLAVEMSGQNMSYDSNVTNAAISLQGASLPFPVEISIAEYGFGIDVPLAKSDEPADFGLRLNLTDFAVNDMIWMMADPTNTIPHDPATILLDLSGKAKLFFDLLDSEQAEAMEDAEMPAEVNALTLNNLQLKAAGVDVSGNGAFTFDNTDMVTFEGYPRPTGDLTLNVKGANALIDNLIKMGILPEDQAMFGRMMMGSFTQVTGDDELTSKIEINDQGNIFANGQKIQ
ncbi:MAG: DUF2125 domain-containing protein [Yoonia sp.]|nr:DUF2125 domain-containing protein [Yoonia sp.]